MKKTILFTSLLISGVALADPVVPSVSNIERINAGATSQATTPQQAMPSSMLLGGKDLPLSRKEQQAIKTANQWVNGKQYISNGGQEVVYTYGAGQAAIIATPLKLSVFELESGERIVNEGIQLGDSVRWHATPVKQGNQTNVIIKPTDTGLSTDLVVVTNRRTYHIKLISNSKNYTPLVKFSYPEDENQKAWNAYYQNSGADNSSISLAGNKTGLAPINFDYTIKGDNKMKPLRVYDNGAQVFIQMDGKLQEIPALFVINGSGKQQLVNYRYVDNTFVVDRLFNKAVLTLDVGGDQEKVTITKG